MDPKLRQLCLEILTGDVNGESFARLLIETGIEVTSFEWDIANKLLIQGDEIKSHARSTTNTLH